MTPTSNNPGTWPKLAIHVTETLKNHEERLTDLEKECAECRAGKVPWDTHNALKATVTELDKRCAVEIATIKTESRSEARAKAFWVALIASGIVSLAVGITVFLITRAL